jgi:CRISPR-associated endonuclease cas1, NMENI subtype
MSFRTVVISKQSKLSYKNSFLVVKQEEDEKYIHLSEIDTIIIDNPTSVVTCYLLKELSLNKINIIFCDEKHNPFGELASFYSRHNSSKQIKKQISWKQPDKDSLWREIIKNKIINQAMLLRKVDDDKYEMLLNYANDVEIGDITNREGHAAKVYFNALFGNDFIRHSEQETNAALNYGYAILLSTINKEVKANGFLTELGINHTNEFNQFNLSCDLMEPFRVIIDNFVYYNKERKLDSSYKLDIVNVFNHTYKYQNKMYTLKDIIKLYVKKTIDSIENIKNYEAFIYGEE